MLHAIRVGICAGPAPRGTTAPMARTKKDDRPKRKISAMVLIEDLDLIQGQTGERDTDLMVRLVGQEAAKLRGAPTASAYIDGGDMEKAIEGVLRKHGLIADKAAPQSEEPKRPRSSRPRRPH